MALGAGLVPKPGPGTPMILMVLYYVLVYGTLVIFLIGLLWKSVKIVPRGHHGLKERNGKPIKRNGKYVVKCPGFHLMIPGIENISITSTQLRTSPLPKSPIDVDNDAQRVVEGDVEWQVLPDADNLFRALYAIEDLTQTLVSRALAAVNLAVSQSVGRPTVADVSDRALDLVAKDASECGVAVTAYRLASIPRTWADVVANGTQSGPKAVAAAIAAGEIGDGTDNVSTLSA